MKDIKLTDVQIEALSTFYMGITAIADMYTAYQTAGKDMSLETMHKFFALIVEGANLTSATIANNTSQEVIEQIEGEADVIDFEAYKRNGGYLN